MNLLFYMFFSPRSSLVAQSEQCGYYVSRCRAERKESWGLWYKRQKVVDEQIDVASWCSPLKVITESDSHGSLNILWARLRIHYWYSLIMRALHSECSDTVWLSNGYTWTLTPRSLSGVGAVTLHQMHANGSLLGHSCFQVNMYSLFPW